MNSVIEKEKKLNLALTKLKNLNLKNPDVKKNIENLGKQKNQLGMTYAELEKVMENKKDPNYQRYLKIRKKNLHKMNPIPVCKFNET